MNVVCAGDCGVDRYLPLDEDRAGGITLNFAAHARRLLPDEATVHVISVLGTDPESRVVRNAIARLDVAAHLEERKGTTSIQFIDLEPTGEKIFVRYDQGVLGEYRVGAKEQAVIAEADLLVAPHYRQIDGFFSSVMAAPSRGLRAVDFADIGDDPTTANVERFLDELHIAFFGLSAPDDPLIDLLDQIAKEADKLFVVTLGAAGSMALTRDGRLRCEAVRVPRVVDTTGAGDTFAAAFLSEYCQTRDVNRSLARGAEEAAQTIQEIGGQA